MSHSQSRVWALFETVNKESGTCSVYLSTRQLHLKDGIVHLYGLRGNRCPGSYKLPLHVSDDRAASLASRSATCRDAASVTAPTFAQNILRVPKRGGRKRNLASAIIKRTNFNPVDDEKSVRTAFSSAKRDVVTSKLATFSAKLEDGNISTAIRISML